jgi:hypothetical protein
VSSHFFFLLAFPGETALQCVWEDSHRPPFLCMSLLVPVNSSRFCCALSRDIRVGLGSPELQKLGTWIRGSQKPNRSTLFSEDGKEAGRVNADTLSRMSRSLGFSSPSAWPWGIVHSSASILLMAPISLWLLTILSITLINFQQKNCFAPIYHLSQPDLF